MSRDSFRYLKMANDWYLLKSYSGMLRVNPDFNWIPPGAIGLMVLLSCFGIPVFYSCIVINLYALFLTGLVVCKIVSLLTKDIKAGYLCGILTVLHPTLLGYGIVVQRESCYLFCCSLFLLGLAYCLKSQYSFGSLICGIGSGCGILVRYEAYELPFLFFILFGIIVFLKKEKKMLYINNIFLFFASFVAFFLIYCFLLNCWDYAFFLAKTAYFTQYIQKII